MNVSSASLGTSLLRKIRWIAKGHAGSAAVAQTFIWRIFLLGLNFLNGVLVFRTIGAIGRGQQTMLMLWPSILPSLLEFGIPFSLVYYARSRYEKRSEFYGTALVCGMFLSLLSMVVGIVGVPHWLSKYDASTIECARYMMLFAPATMLSYFVVGILDSEHAFSLGNVLKNTPTIFTSLVLIGLTLTHHMSSITTSLAYLSPNTLAVLIVGTIALKRYRPVFGNIIHQSKLLFGYGIRLYGTTLVGTFNQQMDQLLVAGLLAPGSLGIYSVALGVSRILSIFPNSLINILSAKVVGRPDEEVIDTVARVARLTMAVTGICAFWLGASLPVLMPLIYGNGLASGVLVTQLLLLENVLASTTWVHLQSYLALNKPGTVTILQTFGLILTIPLMLLLIPRFGIAGAALALLLSTAMRTAIAIAGYRFILIQRVPNIIATNADIRFLINSIRLKRSTSEYV